MNAFDDPQLENWIGQLVNGAEKPGHDQAVAQEVLITGSAYVCHEVMPEELVTQPGAKDTNPKDAIGALKAKVSVIPANVIFDIGLGMTEGMVKYGRHNYRGCGVRASVYYDASMGHLMDWWEGEDVDPDSGLSHVTKAIASLVVLRDAMMQDKLTDDRPPRSKVTKRDFNDRAKQILQSHPDKSPRHWTIADDIDPENKP